MFERFTDKARKVVILAKHKATEQGDAEIRPVHMLYGLAATDGVAARALTGLGVDAAAVERELGNGSPGDAAGPGAQRPGATLRPWRPSASTWTRSSARSRRASARGRWNAYRSPARAR